MDLEKIESEIGIVFRNKKLLQEALTHRSYLNESLDASAEHNERLEFLGDAVLELVVTDALFKMFPKKPEGELTLYRSALVNSRSLAEIAKNIGLDNALLLSSGEAKESLKTKGRDKLSANALEAVIGAIYLDKGYDVVRAFVEKFIMPKIEDVQLGGKDAKSLVQEIAQSKHKITPTYKVLEESGPAHSKVFKVGLYFGENLKAEGAGGSKQEAELEAASTWLSTENA